MVRKTGKKRCNTAKTLCTLFIWACASACATSAGKQDNLNPDGDGLPTSHLALDPMLIEASSKGKTGRTLNADEVFKTAYKAYQARRYEDALKHYSTIIKYFPDSRFFLPSLFNSGLSSEKLERWDDASAYYIKIIQRFPGKKDAKDAYYRLANTYQHLSEHQKTVDLMTEVMLRPDISHFDRIEAHVRRANAMVELGQFKQAELGFRTAIRLNNNASASKRLEDNSHYVVQSYFGMGRAFHGMVMEIPLKLPTEKMGEDLEHKASLFLKAQTAYIRALRVHHPQWSVAAGYMIGRLYEDFYLDILSAEIPDTLNDAQIVLYFGELRKTLKPLMIRAIQVYEKNLFLSQRIDVKYMDNRWANASDKHLKRLKAYLNDPFTQRRAERLVLKRRPLKNLWNPQLMATDVVEEALEKASKSSKSSKKKKLKATH